jgi:hypothetical protein
MSNWNVVFIKGDLSLAQRLFIRLAETLSYDIFCLEVRDDPRSTDEYPSTRSLEDIVDAGRIMIEDSKDIPRTPWTELPKPVIQLRLPLEEKTNDQL